MAKLALSCPHCQNKGFIEEANLKGEPVNIKCPKCNGPLFITSRAASLIGEPLCQMCVMDRSVSISQVFQMMVKY